MGYAEKYEKEIESFVNVCHRLADNRYVSGHGGNLAWKLEDDVILITPTCTYKGDVMPEDVVFISADGETLEGKNRPTGEKPMYLNFFKTRPDVKAALHCHPPMANTFAIADSENLLLKPVFPETTTEAGPVPLVPYGMPLSEDLADNFTPLLNKYNAFMMENHGLVVISPKDIEWCFYMAELIELSAQSVIAAATLGGVKSFGKAELLDLDEVMRIRSLPMFGAPGVNSSLTDVYDI